MSFVMLFLLTPNHRINGQAVVSSSYRPRLQLLECTQGGREEELGWPSADRKGGREEELGWPKVSSLGWPSADQEGDCAQLPK